MITKTLTVSPSTFDMMEAALAAGTMVEDAGRDEVLFCRTVDFGDVQMDIKVVNSEDGPWTEGVLFQPSGDQLGCTEVGESFGGEYIVPDGEKEYCVIVERGK